jgi:hypothetical protein
VDFTCGLRGVSLQHEVWGLVVILVHLTISYFPVVSLGQALAPATSCAWGIWLGCLAVSPLVLVASYGSTATWAALMLLIICMEPIMNNQVCFRVWVLRP